MYPGNAKGFFSSKYSKSVSLIAKIWYPSLIMILCINSSFEGRALHIFREPIFIVELRDLVGEGNLGCIGSAIVVGAGFLGSTAVAVLFVVALAVLEVGAGFFGSTAVAVLVVGVVALADALVVVEVGAPLVAVLSALVLVVGCMAGQLVFVPALW